MSQPDTQQRMVTLHARISEDLRAVLKAAAAERRITLQELVVAALCRELWPSAREAAARAGDETAADASEGARR